MSIGLRPPPEPPPRLTKRGAEALLRQPGWYIYADTLPNRQWPAHCIGCDRPLQPGDIVRCEYGLTLQDMRRRGACCRLPGRTVFTDDTADAAARRRPAQREGGFFG